MCLGIDLDMDLNVGVDQQLGWNTIPRQTDPEAIGFEPTETALTESTALD
jgi:hypothetical protein